MVLLGLVIFLLLLLHYAGFLSQIYSGLGKLKLPKGENELDEYVSIIVPFRNESENILQSLESLEKQSYPKEKFEIIFVDDFSEDDSYRVLMEAERSTSVKVISVPISYSQRAHKKRAIRFGIENAKGSIIVTTDADCLHHPDWLRSLLNYFNPKTGFVSGPVEFANTNSFFGKLQKLEFAGLVLTGAGLVGVGKPTIGNAANIAFRKTAYEAVDGFKENLNISSGDDEFLMQKIAKETAYEVTFSIDKNSIVTTPVNNSIRQFFEQRRRWASKGLFYSDKLLIIKLVLIYLFYLGLITQILLGSFVNYLFLISFVISFLVKIFIEYWVIKKGSALIFDKSILNVFLPAEILHIPYIIIAGISGTVGNYTWKGRKIRR